MKCSTGILPVSTTGVSPVAQSKWLGQDSPATYGQTCPGRSEWDAHTATNRLLTHPLRMPGGTCILQGCRRFGWRLRG